MHGLINRAIQCFVRDTYGAELWLDVTRQARLDGQGFEAMLYYDDALTERVLNRVGALLAKEREALLEDIGIYLVSHPNVEALRRLLRFGGVSFVEFLHSLDDLPDRARLAVSDLELPRLELHECPSNCFRLFCQSPYVGYGHVMLGVLRTMADDYGALVFLDIHSRAPGDDVIEITVIEMAFAEGRSFDLGAGVG
ncbi:heme NO-binding domain-containing protein [Thalassovita taeanensis]|uniref:Haem-NO-binding n=1 Tax=Thalassovita taeanensis TaxID=657014 RepID=A0A1H9ESB6_9RHOB|nr:heme NO-binding domain-containing protein [Thalassovita taeanensis]SEQ27898.1 Haem-NO-binding [Thalassovita taeanensis]